MMTDKELLALTFAVLNREGRAVKIDCTPSQVTDIVWSDDNNYFEIERRDDGVMEFQIGKEGRPCDQSLFFSHDPDDAAATEKVKHDAFLRFYGLRSDFNNGHVVETMEMYLNGLAEAEWEREQDRLEEALAVPRVEGLPA